MQFLLLLCLVSLAIYLPTAQAYEEHAVVVQGDGKILVLGNAFGGHPSSQMVLLRYNVDGSLDTTFNKTGLVATLEDSEGSYGHALVLQNDGKIVIAGSTSITTIDVEMTVWRYLADGRLDATFGKEGVVHSTLAQSGEGVAVLRDGKILVAASPPGVPLDGEVVIERFNPDGALDASFKSTGEFAAANRGSHDWGGCANPVVLPDGRVVLPYYSRFDYLGTYQIDAEDVRSFALLCLNADASLNRTFNHTGQAITRFSGGHAEAPCAVVQPDGKILLGGFATPTAGRETLALLRYEADGRLDKTFGQGGQLTTAVGKGDAVGRCMALQKDGKILLAGGATNKSGLGHDFLLARYLANGSLDSSFGAGGVVTAPAGDFPYSKGQASSITVQSDGKIVVAGYEFDYQDFKVAVMRFLDTGELDKSFNSTGRVITSKDTLLGIPRFDGVDPATEAVMATLVDTGGDTTLKDDDSKVVANVKAGERFLARAPQKGAQLWDVYLPSGIAGHMDRSRLRLLPEEPGLRLNFDSSKEEWRENTSTEVTNQDPEAWTAKEHGVDYYPTLSRASDGDPVALVRFFSLAKDMESTYGSTAWKLLHLVKDKTFAEFLRRQPLEDRLHIRSAVEFGYARRGYPSLGFYPRDYPAYLQRYFPESAGLLHQSEIVDWVSPDQRYAVRKTFSNPLDLVHSQVIRAELIEKATGKVIYDLTPDDKGCGPVREGQVLWSPDSKRFAYVYDQEAEYFCIPTQKHTTLFQVSGDGFTKIDLPPPPLSKEEATEVSGAGILREELAPLRWESASTLVLKKSVKYLRLELSGDLDKIIHHDHEITVSFQKDGTVTASWKKLPPAPPEP